VSNVTAVRLLGSHNNRMENTHVYAVENSVNVLLEECEAYFYHRHGFSIWKSRNVTLRRCYANSMQYGARGCCSSIDNRDFGDEAISVYGSSDSTIENCISENFGNGFQIHGIANPLDPSGHGGRNNRVLGSISFGDAVASLVSSRAFGPTQFHNASGNTFRDFLAAFPGGNGLFFRAASNTRADHVTLLGSSGNSGLSADDGDGSLGGTCSQGLVCPATGQSCSSNSSCSSGVCTKNTVGCSFTGRGILAVNNDQAGISSSSQQSWMVESSNASGNSPNYTPSETLNDGSGSIRTSLSTAPTNVGLSAGQCLAWVPQNSNMATAGTGGESIGARILYRYVNGTLTNQGLWDRATGAFPCGAVIAGVNDGAKRCTNIHTRLNVNTNGCSFPSNY
jgi:hypothetical protein